MKPTKTILVCILAAGMASAQSPSIIQNARDTMNGVSARQTAASNAALGVHESARPSAGIPHSAAKPNVAPVVKVARTTAAKPASVKKPIVKRPVVAAKAVAQVKPVVVAPKSEAPAPATVPEAGTSETAGNEPASVPDSKYAANGRRDPFISPVVSHAGGSGCNTGKKCLEIGAINLRGVVHSESGFIAVVSNGVNKAYFLRENDPVFNGYVVKITGDSIVFQETLQDRLGKSFTREVVKKITTPAV